MGDGRNAARSSHSPREGFKEVLTVIEQLDVKAAHTATTLRHVAKSSRQKYLDTFDSRASAQATPSDKSAIPYDRNHSIQASSGLIWIRTEALSFISMRFLYANRFRFARKRHSSASKARALHTSHNLSALGARSTARRCLPSVDDNEIQIANVNHQSKRLACNEYRVFAIQRIHQQQDAAAD